MLIEALRYSASSCLQKFDSPKKIKFHLSRLMENNQRLCATLNKKGLTCSCSHACAVKACHLQSVLKINLQNMQLES